MDTGLGIIRLSFSEKKVAVLSMQLGSFQQPMNPAVRMPLSLQQQHILYQEDARPERDGNTWIYSQSAETSFSHQIDTNSKWDIWFSVMPYRRNSFLPSEINSTAQCFGSETHRIDFFPFGWEQGGSVLLRTPALHRHTPGRAPACRHPVTAASPVLMRPH